MTLSRLAFCVLPNLPRLFLGIRWQVVRRLTQENLRYRKDQAQPGSDTTQWYWWSERWPGVYARGEGKSNARYRLISPNRIDATVISQISAQKLTYRILDTPEL
jgi:hypothetical protein